MKNNEIKHNIMRDKTHSIPLVKRVNKELKEDFTKMIIRHLLEVWHRSEITKEPLKIKRFSHIRFPRVAAAAVWLTDEETDNVEKMPDFSAPLWLKLRPPANSTYLLLLVGFRLEQIIRCSRNSLTAETIFALTLSGEWRYLDRGMSSNTILQI